MVEFNEKVGVISVLLLFTHHGNRFVCLFSPSLWTMEGLEEYQTFGCIHVNTQIFLIYL